MRLRLGHESRVLAWTLAAGAPALLAGEFLDLTSGNLIARIDGADRQLPLDPSLRLFRTVDGRTASAAEVVLVPGDRLQLIAPAGRVVYLEVEQSRMGAAADRLTGIGRQVPTQIAERAQVGRGPAPLLLAGQQQEGRRRVAHRRQLRREAARFLSGGRDRGR